MSSVFVHYAAIFVIGLAVGLYVCKAVNMEGFQNNSCNSCGEPSPCGCPNAAAAASAPKHPAALAHHESNDGKHCKQPDMNKYVLKTSIPPCPAVPDLSNYILKSECPPVPDLSNYVLKSSIPKQTPVILDCSKCQKAKGECPPCPRPRCPEVQCPAPTKCPSCPPCARQKCPPASVKCKVEDSISDQSIVRPYLASLGFGSD